MQPSQSWDHPSAFQMCAACSVRRVGCTAAAPPALLAPLPAPPSIPTLAAISCIQAGCQQDLSVGPCQPAAHAESGAGGGLPSSRCQPVQTMHAIPLPANTILDSLLLHRCVGLNLILPPGLALLLPCPAFAPCHPSCHPLPRRAMCQLVLLSTNTFQSLSTPAASLSSTLTNSECGPTLGGT